MKYDGLTIQKLRDLPIFDVCSKLGISLYGMGQLTKRAKCWYHDDTHPSMHVNKKKNIYKCFVCGKGGDVIRLVQDYNSLTFPEACDWLVREFSVPVVDTLGSDTAVRSLRSTEGLSPVCQSLPKSEPSVFRPLDASLVQKSLSVKSLFCQSLVTTGLLSEKQMLQAANRYHLGLSKDGGVVFWEIDDTGLVHNGKIMYYLDTCHRDKSHVPTWVIAKLKGNGSLPSNVDNPHCLFGLHLLQSNNPFNSCRSTLVACSEGLKNPLSRKNIAIVESEKSAVILSELFPDYVWLASGGKTMLNASLFVPLGDRRIILFPDTDETGETYRLWSQVASEAAKLYKSRIHVSPLLELHASPAQKAAKIDLVDFLFN